MPPVHAVRSVRAWGLALCASGALLGASIAVAADRGSLSEAQRTYQRDRAACMSGLTSQDRATCLKEASAALQEAKRGNLNDGQAEFERNRVAALQQEQAPISPSPADTRSESPSVEIQDNAQESQELPATASDWFAYMFGGCLLLAMAGLLRKTRTQE